MFRQLVVVCFIAVVFGEERPCGISDLISISKDSTLIECLKQCPSPAPFALPSGANGTCLMATGKDALDTLSTCVKGKGINDFPNGTVLMPFLAQHIKDFSPPCPEALICLNNTVHNLPTISCNIMLTKNIFCGCGKETMDGYKSKLNSCISNTSGSNFINQYSEMFNQVCGVPTPMLARGGSISAHGTGPAHAAPAA